MRKLLCLFAVFAMLCSLAACAGENVIADNAYYRIKVDGENYCLSFKQDNNEADTSGACMKQPSVSFTSITEMKNDILNGNFTDEEKRELQRFPKDEAGTVTICNLQKLYQPVLPADWKLEEIIWVGRYYYFCIGPINDIELTYNTVGMTTQEHFSELLAEYNTMESENIVQLEQVEDRNAIVYSYVGGMGTNIKKIKYTITVSDNKTVYVDEVYYVDESESVPKCINILVDHAGKYLDIYIDELEARPTVEWLSQFGIREYVETEVS